MPYVLFLLSMLVFDPEVQGDSANMANSRTHLDLATGFTGSRSPSARAAFASKMALSRIWNKAVHVIRVKDNDVYLLVRGFRADAVHDFQTFRPTERWTDFGEGAMFGQSGNKIVRLNSGKDRSLPVLEITHDKPYSKTSVVYVDNLEQMENVYNYIKKNNYLVKP